MAITTSIMLLPLNKDRRQVEAVVDQFKEIVHLYDPF
jgi:hypothetical protein